MRNRSAGSTLRWVSIVLLLSSLILTALQLVRFSRLRAIFPSGMTIAEIPVGGLDRQSSAERLLAVYTAPIELRYGDALIHLNPSVFGFQLDLESMLAAADLARTQQPFWQEFWNFLWGRNTPPASIPLRATYSEARLRAYLHDEIAARYDQPPTPAMPAVGTVNFTPGIYGTALDIDRAILLIENALRSPSQRVVELPLQRIQPPRPSFQNLEIMLKQIIDLAGFDGATGLYLHDLQSGQEIHFIYRQGESLPTNPDLSFTAASIIKIPIMVSVFRRLNDTPDLETIRLLEEMIEKSGNDPADWVMERVIDRTRAPLDVSDDMKALGLENTFLAGYFYPGAPLLYVYKTIANSRPDINTDPDIYNQTTPSEIGMLLEDIYVCSKTGGGNLVAVFPGEITQEECRSMITFLTQNYLGSLIEAGVPEGTRVAHKHGWVSTYGIINTIGDAGIIFTPGGDFVLVIFLHHPEQLIWDPSAKLIADLTEAIYNFYNLPPQP